MFGSLERERKVEGREEGEAMFGCFINKARERVFGILALRFETLVSNKFFYSFSFIDFFFFSILIYFSIFSLH